MMHYEILELRCKNFLNYQLQWLVKQSHKTYNTNTKLYKVVFVL